MKLLCFNKFLEVSIGLQSGWSLLQRISNLKFCLVVLPYPQRVMLSMRGLISPAGAASKDFEIDLTNYRLQKSVPECSLNARWQYANSTKKSKKNHNQGQSPWIDRLHAMLAFLESLSSQHLIKALRRELRDTYLGIGLWRVDGIASTLGHTWTWNSALPCWWTGFFGAGRFPEVQFHPQNVTICCQFF